MLISDVKQRDGLSWDGKQRNDQKGAAIGRETSRQAVEPRSLCSTNKGGPRSYSVVHEAENKS